MRLSVIVLSLPALAIAQKGSTKGAAAPKAAGAAADGTLATGPYKSYFFEEPTLPKHTIFAPKEPPAGVKLPVLIWGNGACSANGTLFRRSLWEMASYGFFAIANGGINGGSGMTSQLQGNDKGSLQRAALEWVSKNAGQGKYSYVDGTRIAAAGQSCGGLETYAVWDDKRVSHLGIFNSGEFNKATIAPKINKPIFYFLGGSSDVAYPNGERDYKALPTTTPRWKGNLPVGHMATWSQTNSGKFGKAERLWLQWTLQGNEEAKKFFTDGGAEKDGWTVEKAAMDAIKVFPPYASAPAAAPAAAAAASGPAPAAGS